MPKSTKKEIREQIEMETMFRGHDEEYDVVYDSNILTLIKGVNEKLAENWRVVGGLLWDGKRYLQTMTRYTPGMRWCKKEEEEK